MAQLKITLVINGFELGGAAQQILDRILLGWTTNGRVRAAPDWKVQVALSGDEIPAALKQRQQRFGINLTSDIEAAVAGVDGVLVISSGLPVVGVEHMLSGCADQAALFFHGPWGASRELAGRVTDMVRRNNLRVWTTHADAFLEPLPAGEIFASGDSFSEGLLVAPITNDHALNDALGAWLPRILRRPGAKLAVRRVRKWIGTGVWAAHEDWPADLFAAAISRSDNPMGDSDRESRVQDLAGLGLIPGLTQKIEIWQFEHIDGFRSTLVIQAGIIKDVCLAARTRAGRIVSRQLFRPGPQQLLQYHRLVDQLFHWIEHRDPKPTQDVGHDWTHLTGALQSSGIRAGVWTPVGERFR